MSLLNAIFIPDHILQTVSQDDGHTIMNEALAAYSAAPEFFNAIVIWGRIGAGLLDGEPMQTEQQSFINEGKRQQTLNILAIIKCAMMEEMELQEIISERSKEWINE